MTTSAASTSVVGVIRFLRSGVAVLTVDLSRLRRVFGVVLARDCGEQGMRTQEGDERRDQPMIERVLHASESEAGDCEPERRQAELRERHAGEIAHLRAAGLVLAVDAFDVVRNRRRVGRPIFADLAARELIGRAGGRREPTFDLLLELLDGAEQRGAGRTHVAAGGGLTLLLQMAAELALRDLAERIIEVELRDAERAAIDAVAAADAASGS